MSGLAEILLKEGFTVSGSDNKASALTEQLEKNGAKIFIGQRAANITKDIQLVVYTAAIHPDNAEWKAANDAGIPMLTLSLIHIFSDKQNGQYLPLFL